MNNLSDSAKKKIEEASENFKLSDIPYPPLKNIFKAGYNAGYEVGREEMNQQVQLLEDALNHYACSHYNHENFKCDGDTTANEALESLSKMRGEK